MKLPFTPLRATLRAHTLARRCAPRIAAGLLAAALAGCGEPPEAPPDLLLVSLDTLRADRLSALAPERDTTPFLDSIAAEGTLFESAFASSSHTAPSHMSMLTGLDPLAHGVRNGSKLKAKRLSKQAPSFTEALFEAGWHTAVVSERGNVMPQMGFGRGFESKRFELDEVDVKLAEVDAVLERFPRDEPLFLFFHAYLTHAPYVPPAPYFGRHASLDYDGEFRRRYDALAGSLRMEKWSQSGKFLDSFPGLDADDAAWLAALYDDTVAWADAQIERLIERYDARRDLDNTLLVLLSDHGEEFMEHGALGHRTSLEVELLHVPLIVRGPGIPIARRASPVSLTGLPSTLAELLGVPFSTGSEYGFAHLLRGTAVERDPNLATFHQIRLGPVFGTGEAVRRGDEFMLRFSGGEREYQRFYDLEADPRGLEDLGAQVGFAAELTALLDQRRALALGQFQQHPALDIRLDGDVNARELEALGYIEGRSDE